MTDDPSLWPLPKFFFEVELDGATFSAQEVDGLDVETEVIEYRAGDSKSFSAIKMPGMRKASNVTLKKISATDDNAIWDWFNEIKMNTISRKDVTIRLLDETGAATMVWRLSNAFTVKISATEMTNDKLVAETIELACEGIEIANR